MTAADILWNDLGLYHRRYEKSARALLAIHRILSEKRPLGGREEEFLRLFEKVAASDARLFTRVWSDPTAYFWVRLAYEYVGNCVTPGTLSRMAAASAAARGAAGDSSAALQRHLSDFKRFALGMAVISDQDIQFEEPLETSAPFAIPTTGFIIDGAGNLVILGYSQGCIEAERDGVSIRLPLAGGSPDGAAIRVRQSPSAELDGYRLPLQPEMFNLPGLAVGKPLLEVTPEYEAAQADLATRTLAAIARHAPAAFAHFKTIVRAIALKPAGLGDYTNISHSDMPGSFVCTVIRNEYWMADAFIHEFYHNRLFFIEETGSFFAREEDNQVTRSEFYSPWRENLRPLHGIFHGLYVYIPIWRFWSEIHSCHDADALLAAAARDQILRTALQLEIGVSQLRRFGEFTAFGASLFEAMADEITRIKAMTRDLGIPRDAPSVVCSYDGVLSVKYRSDENRPQTVRESILEHAANFDHHRQCAEIESIVRA